MNPNQRVAFLFIFLLVGSEAMRVETALKDAHVHMVVAGDSQNSQAEKTPDLDFPGCGEKSLTCRGVEGCTRRYLWLDTPRQSCRFTDEYKLAHEQATFLRVELARLMEKSVKFASTGCLWGTGFSYDTYMWKCVRRTQQMIRLTRFVSKAVEAARDDSTHPAHQFATSQEAQISLSNIGDNIAAGFDKYDAKGGSGLAFGEAYKKLLALPAAEKEACSGDGCDMNEEERKANEEAYVTEAMFEVVGTKLTDDQKAALAENIADSNQRKELEGIKVDALVDSLESDIEATNLAGGVGDMEGKLSDEQQEVFEEALTNKGLEDGSALLQTNVTSALQAGPIKWLFTHGLGWIVTRIAWLFLFIVGSALGIIRAGVIWPLMLVGCTLMKTVKWLFADLLIAGGWDGDGKQVVKGFKSIGKCPSWAWQFVGFDPKLKGGDLPGQVFVQPAKFASDVTNVVHLWKSEADMCKDVVCGANALCHAGQCFCKAGLYPLGQGASDCGQLTTEHGCVCLPTWKTSTLVIFSETRYGCGYGRCKVDQRHPSFSACQSKIKRSAKSQFISWAFGTSHSVKDTCRPQSFQAKVRPTTKP